MQAVILAAGMGKRLKELTKNNTKCMVEVNGVTLIERLLRMLDRKNLSRIILVAGYQKESLISYINSLQIHTPIVFIDNPVYDKTNNIYSLALASDYLEQEDTLMFESDLIFEERIVDRLISDQRETLAVVDRFESWMDGTCMVLDPEDNITDFVPGKYVDFLSRIEYYKTVNIYKFSKHFSATTYVPFLEAYRKAMGENEYYESVIKLIAMLGTNELKAMRLQGEIWYEIDDIQDLDIAETLFANDRSERYEKISGRYGGYWRYPKMLDFCYLVNPFFPSRRMMDELEANLDTLVRNYPSGMSVNSLLAGKNFGLPRERVLVGNGAAELIKALMEYLPELDGEEKKVGVIRPTFEEYPNRYNDENCVVFRPETEGFRYDENDLIRFFSENPVRTIVLINPDNPTGNYLSLEGVKQLLEWTKKAGVRLILDESFMDFATENEEVTFAANTVLTEYPELFVVKSISKSYGVPGLRLGVLSSGDENTIATLKKRVAIWNINSIGEFYMQIYEKYRKEYKKSLALIAKCREELFAGLSELPHLRPFPSKANYIMCELENGRKAREVAELLLERNIFIKDLTKKAGNGKEYIRLAVRNEEDNQKLLDALRDIL